MKTIKRTKISDLLKSKEAGVEVNVKGWVRTRRSSKQVAFVALNDGSTINNVQVVIDADKFDEELVNSIGHIMTNAEYSTKGICTWTKVRHSTHKLHCLALLLQRICAIASSEQLYLCCLNFN